MSHRNASLTPTGRLRLARCIVESGWPLRRAADRRTEWRIIRLWVSRRWGPVRISYRLRLNPSTVHKVLVRYGAPPLAWTDPATGTRLRGKPKPQRYEHATPGDLVHVDVNEAGPDPQRWRAPGPRPGHGQSNQEEHQAWYRVHPQRDR